MPTLAANRQRYQAEGSAALLIFTRPISTETGAFTATGNSAQLPRGYYLAPASAAYAVLGGDANLPASLRFSVSTGSFSHASPAANLARGFVLDCEDGSLLLAGTSNSILLSARVIAPAAAFAVSGPATALQRALVFAASTATFTVNLQGSGFQFQPPAPAAGQRREKPLNPYGGSDDTGGSFVRPQYVKYNSALKAKDFGLVSNLLSIVEGELGSQAGSNTAFFVVETDGPAQLFIRNDTTSSFTKNYLSVGILDSDRKPLPLNQDGFAYRNDDHATALNEATESLPAGVYYFTISCNQWQAIPFTATIQVLRFRSLIGAAGGTLAPYGRFALSKLYGAAALTGPMSGAVVPDTQINRLSGAVALTATPVLSLAIMRGAAVGTMTPYGRLKQTHRISGSAIGIGSSVATLSSIPPYGGGY